MSMYFREALGEVLREERNAKGMTLRTTSSKGFIALGYLSEVERGQKEISSEPLDLLAKALGVAPSEIVLRTAIRMAGLDVPDTPESLFDPRNMDWQRQYSDLLK